MANIIHRIGIDKSADEVYRAVATVEGLKGWWTQEIEGESKEGKRLEFRFPNTGPVMEVLTLIPSKKVEWKCVDSIDQWSGTTLHFDITPDEPEKTTLLFAHRSWKDETGMFAHCNTKWGAFMLSLKDYVETGTGRPFPNDTKIW